MADIIALTLPEVITRLRIPVANAAAFEANPLPEVWDVHDDEMMELKDWLDANTPGWETVVRRVGAREHELVIGGDVLVVEYEVRVLFQQPAHRKAYRDR